MNAGATPPPQPAARATCEHTALYHETRRRTVCKACGCRMVRDAGDWRPARPSEEHAP